MLLNVLLITAIAGVVGTGLGGVVSSFFKRDSSHIVSLLLSFAGGVMISIVTFDLIVEALSEVRAQEESLGVFLVMGGILFGYGIVYLLNYVIDRGTNHEVAHIDENHPKTADSLEELIHSDHYSAHRAEGRKLFLAGLIMAAAIALHNLPEGMVIGASFASGDVGAYAGGILMAIVIGLHNIPEGMAVAVPLISGGMSRPRAIAVTALSGAPTVIGALLGYSLGMLGPIALSLSLAFASGAMLYVVLGELLPESILLWRSKLPAFSVLLGILVGLGIIYF